jgi:hypothetical protein
MIIETFTENLVNCVGFHIEWAVLTLHMKKYASRILSGENIFKQHVENSETYYLCMSGF